MLLEQNISGMENVWQVKNDLLGSNTYICEFAGQKKCVLVDPGSNSDEVDDILSINSLTINGIFCTHGHFDHIAGVHFFQSKYECQVHIPELDIDVANKSNFMLMAFNYNECIKMPKIDVAVTNGFKKNICGNGICYYFYPGHTNGSSVIQIGNALFTGDTLYAREVALSKLPGANTEKLKLSISNILNDFDENMLVLPGHGRVATLKDIKKNNVKLRSFLEGENSIAKPVT